MKRTEVTITMEYAPDFTIQGYEFVVDELPLVVHRIGPDLGWAENCPGGWAVTEPTTGCAVPGTMSETRKGACMLADNDVRRRGVDEYHREMRRVLRSAKKVAA